MSVAWGVIKSMENAHPHNEDQFAESAANPVPSVSRLAFDIVFESGLGVTLEVALIPAFNENTDAAVLRRTAELRKKFVAASRLVGQHEAERMRALAEIQDIELNRAAHHSDVEIALRSRAAECAAAMGMSDRTILAQMGDAHTLVHSFPKTLSALENGTITLQHVKVIVHEGSSLGDDTLDPYEVRCLEIATQTSPGRLRAKARIIAQTLAPQTIDERHKAAAAERRIWVKELP